MRSPATNPSSVSDPWTAPTAIAEAMTPTPKEAAKAIEANPSSTAFRTS